MAYRYSSLRTNLPREIMSYSDFPFIPEAMHGRSKDPRRFPHHTEVCLKAHTEVATFPNKIGASALEDTHYPEMLPLLSLHTRQTVHSQQICSEQWSEHLHHCLVTLFLIVVTCCC